MILLPLSVVIRHVMSLCKVSYLDTMMHLHGSCIKSFVYSNV